MPYAPIGEGLRIYYEDFGPPAAPAIVLIRGTGADGTRWLPQVEAYRSEFRVVIFDNRGVGKSDTPPAPYSVAQMAGDTVALMDHLNIERAHLSGSSLGGAIALDIACHHPNRVISLQLHSSWLATHGYATYSLGLLKRFLDVGGTDFYYEATLPLLFSPAFMSHDYERLMSILRQMKANSASLEGLAGQIAANLTHDLREEAPTVTAPTLVTVGELDCLLPVTASRELADAIPGADFVVFPGAPHLVTMESPDDFNKTTLEWLRGVPDSS